MTMADRRRLAVWLDTPHRHAWRGDGAAMSILHSDRMSAPGAPAVLIDPDPDNLRAVHAFRRAGFRGAGLRTDGDADPGAVMRNDPSPSLWIKYSTGVRGCETPGFFLPESPT